MKLLMAQEVITLENLLLMAYKQRVGGSNPSTPTQRKVHKLCEPFLFLLTHNYFQTLTGKAFHNLNSNFFKLCNLANFSFFLSLWRSWVTFYFKKQPDLHAICTPPKEK